MVAVSGNSRRPPGGGGPTLLLTIIFGWVGELASHVSNLQLLTTLRVGISRLFGTGTATESVGDVPVSSGHPTEAHPSDSSAYADSILKDVASRKLFTFAYSYDKPLTTGPLLGVLTRSRPQDFVEVECVQLNDGKKLNTSDEADSSGIDYLSGHISITRPGEKEHGWQSKEADLLTQELPCYDVDALSDQHESRIVAPVEEKCTNGTDELVLPATNHFVSAVPCNEGPMSSPKVTSEADSSAVADVEPSQAATIPPAKCIENDTSSLPVGKNSGPEVHLSNFPLATEGGPLHPSNKPLATDGGPPHPSNSPLATDGGPPHPSNKPLATEGGPSHPSNKPLATEGSPPHPSNKPLATEGSPPHFSNSPMATDGGPPHPSNSPLATDGGPPHPTNKPLATEGGPPHSSNKPLATEGDPPHFSNSPLATEKMTAARHLTPPGKDGGTKHQTSEKMKTNLAPLASDSGCGAGYTT